MGKKWIECNLVCNLVTKKGHWKLQHSVVETSMEEGYNDQTKEITFFGNQLLHFITEENPLLAMLQGVTQRRPKWKWYRRFTL
jgi:hypothetical protein